MDELALLHLAIYMYMKGRKMAIFSGWGRGWSGNKDNNESIYVMINLKFTPHWHIQHACDDSLALLKYLMSDKSFFYLTH